MTLDQTYRAAAADDIARLRAFLATHSEQASHMLDRHLAGPRYRPALTRVAQRGGTIVGCALLAHRRLRLGAATLKIGQIELIDAMDGEEGFAALLGDCLGALLAEGLPLA